METPRIPRAPWVRTLDEAGWTLVADRILHGLKHNLTGRVASIGGLTYLLESAERDASSIIPFFSQELEQLEKTIRLLSLLPDDSIAPELLAPGEIIEDLSLLVTAQWGLERVEVLVEGLASAPAVRIDRSFFVRSVTMLLTAAGETAVISGEKGVRVRAGEVGGGLTLEVWPIPTENEGGEGDTDLLHSRILPWGGMKIWMDALAGEGVNCRESAGEEGLGALQMSFPSPFPS